MSPAAEDMVGPIGHPGLPVAPLGEPARQLPVELASSAGAVMGDVDIPVSVAYWKAAGRFNGCPSSLVDESLLGGGERADAGSDLTTRRHHVLQPVAGHCSLACDCFPTDGLWCPSGRACRRPIVARWLIDFRGLMLTPDKSVIAMCPRQPYS
jgi:hypothetical protein